MLAVEQKKYQCSYCFKQFTGRKNESELLEKTRRIQGCKELVEHNVTQIEIKDSNGWNRGQITFKRCPGNFINFQIGYLLNLHSLYEKGIMPYSGSISDQPYKIIQVFDVISDWKLDYKKRMESRANRRNLSGRNRTGANIRRTPGTTGVN